MRLYSACVCVKVNNEELVFFMLSRLKIHIILFLTKSYFLIGLDVVCSTGNLSSIDNDSSRIANIIKSTHRVLFLVTRYHPPKEYFHNIEF